MARVFAPAKAAGAISAEQAAAGADRSAPSDAARRPRRRNCHAYAALGASAAGRGTIGVNHGRAGTGKSRLIKEFHSRVRDTPHTWVEWSCLQLLQNTPLHPIADSVGARFGGSDLSAEQRLAELENSLSQVKLDPLENAALRLFDHLIGS